MLLVVNRSSIRIITFVWVLSNRSIIAMRSQELSRTVVWGSRICICTRAENEQGMSFDLEFRELAISKITWKFACDITIKWRRVRQFAILKITEGVLYLKWIPTLADVQQGRVWRRSFQPAASTRGYVRNIFSHTLVPKAGWTALKVGDETVCHSFPVSQIDKTDKHWKAGFLNRYFAVRCCSKLE